MLAHWNEENGMSECDSATVERIIANTINETARGDPDALLSGVFGVRPLAGSFLTRRWREEDSNRRSLSQTSRLSDGTRDAARAKRRVSAASAIFRGTERSNPASSASEADASHRT